MCKKYILTLSLISIILSLTPSISNSSYTKQTKQKNKIITKENEKIVISPKKIGPGIWQITKYNHNAIELLEDIKEPFPSFIFKSIKPSESIVELAYNENNKRTKEVYKIIVLAKNEKKLNKPSLGRLSGTLNKNNTSYIVKAKLALNETKYHNYILKLFKMKLYKETINAIEDFEILFNNSNKIQSIILLKANIFTKLKIYKKAIALYNNLIEQNINTEQKIKILFLLEELYKQNKNYQQSKLTLANIIALSKNPINSAKAYFKLGEIYSLHKKYYNAIKQFEKVVEKFPEEKKIREKALYLLATEYYKNTKLQNYYLAYSYLYTLKKEFPYGVYYKKTKNKMKYLEENFINFF